MDGVLNINKPKGISSYGVVARVKKILKVQKVGHAGTLDPEATGVLLVCLGKATKIVQFLMSLEKEYRGEMLLGISTDTDDAQGNIIKQEEDVSIPETSLREVFKEFLGEINQTPPMVSAVKHEGKRLYQLARAGVTVLPKPRKVQIYKIDILSYKNSTVKFNVVCSKGTYIRALCRDIGHKLGCGAHLKSLQRLRIGSFNINSALSLEELENSAYKNNIDAFLYSADAALEHLPNMVVNNEGAIDILGGIIPGEEKIISFPKKINGLLKIHNLSSKLLAVAQVDSNSKQKLKLVRVFS
ncbi:MAG: tRNA pseudouridine(55) synthase TruB [bacterium]